MAQDDRLWLEDDRLWLEEVAARPIPADRLLMFLDVVHLLAERALRWQPWDVVSSLERDERDNPQGLSLERIDALFAGGRLTVAAQHLGSVVAELAFIPLQGSMRDRPKLHRSQFGHHPHWAAQCALRTFLRENERANLPPLRCQLALWWEGLFGTFCKEHRTELFALARLYAAFASGEVSREMLVTP